MAGQLIELFNSRTELLGDKPSAEFQYVALQCADEAEVRSLALAGAPALYNGLVRRTVEIADRITNNAWKVQVRYDAAQPLDFSTPPSVFSFDSSGGTQHITQSLLTVNRYGPSSSALLGGAIGYDGENVAGVDITVPVWNWQETHYLTNAQLNSPAYYALTGMVNSDGFHGYQPGEVLFLGAQGQKRGNSFWEVSFKFAASPNQTGISVGSINGIAKAGWDYLWVQYGQDVDSTAKVRIKKPIAAYVERVYDHAPFSILGI
ncbi:hypothetical protein QQ056_01140 [Oscillatoria laete-virens NRMC-F 0139]|nr:hypothetical protein [Oscillatoria laete-virens]MDL5052176.1 hypothetical protein [Oscillatoria laete-virens NRMC-F 0139]